MPRPGTEYNRHALQTCLTDPSCSEEDWSTARRLIGGKQPQYRRNFNFVRQVSVGSIAMIPRPARGVIYCGRVDRPFELVNDPAWYDGWEKIFCATYPGTEPNRPELYLAGEVAQVWHVDRFVPVPVPRIPAWIRRSLFGRSTYGIVPSDGLDPFSVVSEVLDSPTFPVRDWTIEPAEIATRLRTDLVPASFEHLVVSLIQLEHPDEVWTQVGGSGDGGVDGIGADSTGGVIGLLQCKWAFHGGTIGWPELWASADSGRRYVASLIHKPTARLSGPGSFLGQEEIVQLVLKHAARLPLALSLRIGRPGTAVQ